MWRLALGLVPEVLDAVDVVGLVAEEFGMIDTHMVEFGDVERVVASEAVSIDDGIRPDFIANDRKKRCRRDIWDDGDINVPVLLQKPEHRNLAGGAAPAFAFADSAEIAFINFDLATQQFGRLQGQFFKDDFAQLVEKQDR